MNVVSSIIGILLIVGVGGFVFWQKSANDAALQTAPAAGTWVDEAMNVPNQPVSNSGEVEVEHEGEIEDEDDDSRPAATTPTPVSNTGGTPSAGGMTAAQVAQHNSRSSCWSSINGSVYDLTSWIPKHPGGEQAILQLCGKDGSAKFNGQHGGQAKQATILAGFKIGVLAN